MSSSSAVAESTVGGQPVASCYKDQLNLKLRKPNAWKWELTTSKSSSAINFPHIRLYDHHNRLLAEADEADKVFHSSKANSATTPSHPTHDDIVDLGGRVATSSSLRSSSSQKRSRTADMSNFIDALRTEMSDRGYECKVTQRKISDRPVSASTSRPMATTAAFDTDYGRKEDNEAIPINVTLPAPPASLSLPEPLQKDRNHKELRTRRSNSSSKSVVLPVVSQRERQSQHTMTDSYNKTPFAHSLEEQPHHQDHRTSQYSLKKSRSSAAVIPSTVETMIGSKKKPQHRRTAQSDASSLRFSTSILERLSEMKRRCSSSSSSSSSSSPSTTSPSTCLFISAVSDEEMSTTRTEAVTPTPHPDTGRCIAYTPPKYELRTCPAGTLVVKCDSFETNLNTTVNSKSGQLRRRRRHRRSTSVALLNTEPTITSPGARQILDQKASVCTVHMSGHKNAGNAASVANAAAAQRPTVDRRYDRAIENIEHLINRAIGDSNGGTPKVQSPHTGARGPRRKHNPRNIDFASLLSPKQRQYHVEQPSASMATHSECSSTVEIQQQQIRRRRQQFTTTRQRSSSAGANGERRGGTATLLSSSTSVHRRKCWSLSSSSSSSVSCLDVANDMSYDSGQVIRTPRRTKHSIEDNNMSMNKPISEHRLTKGGDNTAGKFMKYSLTIFYIKPNQYSVKKIKRLYVHVKKKK